MLPVFFSDFVAKVVPRRCSEVCQFKFTRNNNCTGPFLFVVCAILDIKKTIMALRTNLHGRPLAIIREEDTVNGDPGNTYDIPVMGFEWSKLIDFRPRMGGSGRKLLYLHLMFSEVGSLAPYHCRECEQEVSAAGGTCDLCSRFLASMHIKVF